MHTYLHTYWEDRDKPEVVGDILSQLSLWETESGGKEPMDGSVFPEWLRCANVVLTAEATAEGYRGADITLDGKPPTIKVRR
jgi:hypothetical protein